MDININPSGIERNSSENSAATIQQQLAECQAMCRQMEGVLQANVTELERSRLLYENLPALYFTLNFNGVILSINPLGAECLGYATEELIDRAIFSLVEVEDRQRFQDAFTMWVQSSALEGHLQGQFSRFDGSILWVFAIARRCDASTNSTIFLVCGDIELESDRLRYREAIAPNEALLQNVLNTLPIGVWIADATGRTLQANPASQKIWGGAQHIADKAWYRETGQPIEDRELPIRKVLATGESVLNEMMDIQNFDGTRKTILHSVVPMRNATQEITGAVIVDRDITEQLLVEKALWENQRFIQQIADSIPALLYLYDLIEQRNIYCNRQVGEILGYSPEEIEKMGTALFQNLLHPDDRAHCSEKLKQLAAAKDGEIVKIEYRMRHANGEWRWLISRDTVFARTADGTPKQILGIATDISDGKLAEAELDRYRNHLEQLVAVRTEELTLTNQKLQQEIIDRQTVEEERDRVFNLSLDILAIAGFDGYFKRLNPALTTILGYAIEEFLSTPFLDFVHPEDRLRTEQEIQQKLSFGELTLNFENRYRCKDGSYKWLTWSAVPLPDEGLIYAVARDTTERKIAEEALRESREKYRILFDTLPVGISIVDERGNFIEFNKASEEILGISKKEHANRKYDSQEWQIIQSDGTPMPTGEYPSVMALAENRVVENVVLGIVKVAGQIVWLSVTAAPIPLEGYGVAIAYIDVTARKQAEEALSRSEKLFRTLAENTPDIITRFDRQKRHLYVNPAVKTATGLSCETFIGKTHRELGMPDEQVVQWEKMMQQVWECGSEVVIEFNFPSPSGIKYYQARMVPEFSTNEKGRSGVESLLSIARDITDRKQIEEELLLAKARLQHLFETSPAVIYSCKPSGDYGTTFIGENVTAMLGYEAREFLEDSSFWMRRIHPEDKQRIFYELPQVFETGHYVCEYRFQHLDDSYRWIYDEMQLVRDAEGNSLEIVGSWIDITDRKLVEEQLIGLSQAVASASDAIGMADVTGASTYHNQAFLQMFGYTPEQLNAAGGTQIIFTDETLARRVFDTIVQGNSWSGEVQLQNRQGKMLDILLRAYAIKDNGGIPIGLVSVYTDITERKRSLVALQEREMRFRTLAETVTAAIFISQGTQIRYVNSAAEILTGYTREELLAGGTDLIHPQLQEFILMSISQRDSLTKSPANSYTLPHSPLLDDCGDEHFHTRVGEEFSISYLRQEGQQIVSRREFKLLTKTGQERWVDFSVALMQYDGQLAALSAAFDITDRKLAEESMKYRVELEQLIGNISTRFLNLQPDEIDRGINQALQDLGEFMGVDRTYVYAFAENGTKMNNSHEWCDRLIEPQIQRLQNVSLNSLTSPTGEISEMLSVGAWRSQEMQSLLLVPLTVGGSAIGAIGCDAVFSPKIWTEEHITLLRIVGEIFVTAMERRRCDRELQQQAAELARSNAELEQFAYIASHDLQEPLRAVISYTQLLAKRYSGQLDAKADQYIAFAVDGASRMQTLIEDLLLYSRVGTRGVEFKSVDCMKAFETVLVNLRVAIEESSASIKSSDLPKIQGDPTQIVQLLQNLISNAIKYRSQDRPKIRVSAELHQNEWRFSVSDNGIGIDRKYSDRIFLVFQRLHTREEYPGTGIGLAICKKIVERHGGRIWFDSLPGEGSTFYFTIPNAQEFYG